MIADVFLLRFESHPAHSIYSHHVQRYVGDYSCVFLNGVGALMLRRTMGVNWSRKTLSQTLSCFRITMRTCLCFEIPWELVLTFTSCRNSSMSKSRNCNSELFGNTSSWLLSKGSRRQGWRPFQSEQQLHCFLRTYLPGCQRRHLRLNAPVHGFACYVACYCVFLERW